MNQTLKNIGTEKLTTGVALVTLIAFILEKAGVSLAGISNEVLLSIAVVLQSILGFISKDPEHLKEWVLKLFKKKQKV